MSDSAKRVQKHRDKMRAAGLKPVTIWVPDVRSEDYKRKVARAIEVINADRESRQVMDDMLALSDFSDWKA